MNTDRWTLTLAGLLGQPWPMPPELPGVVHLARDEPIAAEYLIGVTDPTELSKLLGISRKAAEQRLNQPATTNDEGPTP